MRRRMTPTSFAVLAAAVGLSFSAGSCRQASPTALPTERDAIAAQMARMNETSYPGGSYTVRQGDTPRGIASRLGVSYTLFAAANGITENTTLTPGWVLVVPTVGAQPSGFAAPAVSGGPARRLGGGTSPKPVTPSAASPRPAAPGTSDTIATVKPAPSAAPSSIVTTQSGTRNAGIGPDGKVSALYPGTVTEVRRGYPSLGDVVIIETADKTARFVYAGSFTPSVLRGSSVDVGDAIGIGAKPGGVKVTRFSQGRK